MTDRGKSSDQMARLRKKLATRRKFLKGVAATGAVAALYTVPKFTTAHAKKAYAAVTGLVSPDSAATTPEEAVITFEETAGVELAPGSEGGAHWQESGYDVKATGHYHREFDGVSMSLYIHSDYPASGRLEITCVTGSTFSISSVDITLVEGGGVISSNKGGSTSLSPGTNSLAGSNWTGVSKVTITADRSHDTQVWVDNISVSKP